MNQLNVSLQHSIATLAAKGWSSRKMARELDVDRETVRRYRRAPDSKPAIPPPGSASEAAAAKPAIPPAGSESDPDSKPAIVPAGCLRTATSAGRTSQCEPFSATIGGGIAGRVVGATHLSGSGQGSSIHRRLRSGEALLCDPCGFKPPNRRFAGWNARRARSCRWISGRARG